MILPYSSISIQWRNNEQEFTLSLPWVSLEVEVSPQDTSWIKRATNRLHIDPLCQEVQQFLKFFDEYNVFYNKPRSLEDSSLVLEQSNINCSEIDLRTPKSLYQWILNTSSFSLNVPLSAGWEWDLEEIYEVSAIEKSLYFDPCTIFSFLKGKILEIDTKVHENRQHFYFLLDKLREKDEVSFFQFMGKMLKQTHYTCICFQRHIPLILEIFPSGRAEIEEYIQQEKGHEQLMERSLYFLGTSPALLEPFPEVVFLMECFKKAVESSSLLFILTINFFEGNFYSPSDPWADILKKSSCPKAALGQEKHFKLNKQKNHNTVAETLAKKLPFQTKEQVTYAIRVIELMVWAGNKLDQLLVSQVQALLEEAEKA
jgi:hypothetical protein